MTPEEQQQAEIALKQLILSGHFLAKGSGQNEINFESKVPEGTISITAKITPTPMPDNVIQFPIKN